MNRIVEPGNPLASGAGNNETLTRLSVQPAILAGGASSRLWPLSRERNPKQLIDLMGDESLLEATLRRLDAAFVVAARSATASGMATAAPLATSTPLVVCCEDLRLQTLGWTSRAHGAGTGVA
jgi:mannose-1-phosphate guanylyltransferase / mannose-6-phosphate isomerase